MLLNLNLINTFCCLLAFSLILPPFLCYRRKYLCFPSKGYRALSPNLERCILPKLILSAWCQLWLPAHWILKYKCLLPFCFPSSVAYCLIPVQKSSECLLCPNTHMNSFYNTEIAGNIQTNSVHKQTLNSPCLQTFCILWQCMNFETGLMCLIFRTPEIKWSLSVILRFVILQICQVLKHYGRQMCLSYFQDTWNKMFVVCDSSDLWYCKNTSITGDKKCLLFTTLMRKTLPLNLILVC